MWRMRTIRKALEMLIAKVLDFFGHYFISPYDKKNLWWHNSDLERHLRRITVEDIGWRGGRERRLTQRRWNLTQMAKTTAFLGGDTAEFGVASGSSSRLIAEVTQVPNHLHKKHWMFDSFEGLPAPTIEDTSPHAPILWSQGMLSYPRERAEQLMAHNRFEIVQGFLPDSLEGIIIESLSFAHIDLDLKQGTVEVLDFCWNRLVCGGILVIDDYGSVSCPGVKPAVEIFSASISTPFAHLSTGQAVFLKSS